MGNIDIIKERIGDSIKAKESLLTNDQLLDTVSNLADEIVACISHETGDLRQWGLCL